MELIDSHAHLTSAGLIERLDEVLAKGEAAGVGHVITVAVDVADGVAARGIAARRPMVSATAGIHPHEAAKVNEGDIDRIAQLLGEPEVVAVGEIGLDYYYDFADRDTQIRVLSMQLEMAAGYDLPVVLHCREAFEDTVDLLARYGFHDKPVVFHCFTGSVDEARTVADRGWRISFTGMVTFKHSTDLLPIVRDYPADGLMLESDSPYLSPVPVRHVRPNEPAHLVHTARFLADLRGELLAALARLTTGNTRRFFNLPS